MPLPEPSPVRYVTATDWGLSYAMRMGSDPGGPGMLRVSRLYTTSDGYDVEHHPEHDGREFVSRAAKDAYCLAHGLLRLADTPPRPLSLPDPEGTPTP